MIAKKSDMPLLAGEKKAQQRHGATRRSGVRPMARCSQTTTSKAAEYTREPKGEEEGFPTSAREGERESECKRAEGGYGRLEHHGPIGHTILGPQGGGDPRRGRGIIVDPLNRSIYNGRK